MIQGPHRSTDAETGTGVTTVLFDLDGTLWQVASDLDFAIIESLQVDRVGASLDTWSIKHDDLKAGIRRFWEVLDAAEKRPYPGHRELDHAMLLREVLNSQAIAVSRQQSQALWADLYVSHPEFAKELFEDTLDTLSLLRARGLKLGIVSNRPWASSVFRPDLDLLGLGSYFGVVVSSADVGFRKPHQRIFETALRALGDPPTAAIMVGDSLVNDIAGAEAYGMRAVWKTLTPSPAGADTDRLTVQTISEILDLDLL